MPMPARSGTGAGKTGSGAVSSIIVTKLPIVGAIRRAANGSSRPVSRRTSASNRAASSELPPSSKKLSSRPIGAKPNSFSKCPCNCFSSSVLNSVVAGDAIVSRLHADRLRIASRHSGLRSAVTLATPRPLTALRAAASEGLPLCVTGKSSTAMIWSGTCAALRLRARSRRIRVIKAPLRIR